MKKQLIAAMLALSASAASAQTPQFETGADFWSAFPYPIGAFMYGALAPQPMAFGERIRPGMAAPDECARRGRNGVMLFDNGAGVSYAFPNSVTWCDITQPGADWSGNNVFTRSSK